MNIDEIKFDHLKMYFGDDYTYNNITIHQPTLGNIIRFGENNKYGEKDFYSSLNIFTGNPTTYRVMLWDAGIDWNKISDFDLFILLYSGINKDFQKMIFGDLDLTEFKPYQKNNNDGTQSLTLYNPEKDIEFSEETYCVVSKYLRTMFDNFPKVEKAKGKMTKEMIIEMERQELSKNTSSNYESSILLPLISTCLNYAGFKYKKSELEDVGIVEFMDSVKRIQVFESTTALLKGMYSGMIDASHINSDAYNFMKDLYTNK